MSQIEVQRVEGVTDAELHRLAHLRRPEEYAQAIEAAQGLVSVAARRLGVTRSAVYYMISTYPFVAEALEDARERAVDVAEAKLFSRVNEGDMTAIIFTLKTLGKKRGYVERQERVHSGSVNLNFQELSDDELRQIANGIPTGDTR